MVLFMPHPHGVSVPADGDRVPMKLIDGLVRLGRQVVAFDPPGVGRSTRPMRCSRSEMISAAEESLDAFGVSGPVDVVGHSQGAFAALAFGGRAARAGRRLLLSGVGAGGPSWRNTPGSIWRRGHPQFWHFGLWALLYQLTRRRAAAQRFLAVLERASFMDPRRRRARGVSVSLVEQGQAVRVV